LYFKVKEKQHKKMMFIILFLIYLLTIVFIKLMAYKKVLYSLVNTNKIFNGHK